MVMLKQDLDIRLKEMELRMIIWLGGVVFTSTTVSVSVLLWFMNRWHI
jgi:hypothetical protein